MLSSVPVIENIFSKKVSIFVIRMKPRTYSGPPWRVTQTEHDKKNEAPHLGCLVGGGASRRASPRDYRRTAGVWQLGKKAAAAIFAICPRVALLFGRK